MVYEFPPSQFISNVPATVAIHLILLAAALLPLFFVWVRTKRPARKSELWIITAAMTFVPVCLVVVAPGLPTEWIPFLVLYALFFELVSIISLFVIGRRLKAQGEATSVVKIIASLFAFGFLILCLLPATPSAREAAKRMQCSNNLKNVALALITDEQQRGALAPLNPILGDGVPTSWRVEMLPFLERKSLYDSYDHSAPSDGESNAKFASVNIGTYTCPTNPKPADANGRYFTAYLRPFGAEVKTTGTGKVDLSNISRSNSIAIVEACGQNIIWTEPRDALVDDSTIGINLPGKQPGTSDGALSSYHTGGVQVAKLDGAVMFLSKSIDPKVLKQLLNGVGPDEQLQIDD